METKETINNAEITRNSINKVSEELFSQLQQALGSKDAKNTKMCIGNLKDFAKLSKSLMNEI